MNDAILINQLISRPILHDKKGVGQIKKVSIENGKIIFSVIFDEVSNGQVNRFIAKQAFEKNALCFVYDTDEEIYRKLQEILDQQTNVEQRNTSSDKEIVSISKNSDINCLISTLKNDEHITLQLIEKYGDKEFEKTLFSETFIFLHQIANGQCEIEDKVREIIIGLSYLALKYYDGSLHPHIMKFYNQYLCNEIELFSESKIISVIYKILEPYEKKVKYFNNSSHIAVPLIFSLVPHYKVTDLYKIAFDIYRKKLLFNEDLSDGQIEEKVEECLIALKREDLISDSDTIKGTEYLMSKYTQSCIYSGYNFCNLIKLISKCIRLIICHLTREHGTFIIPPYFSEGHNEWVKSFTKIEKEKFETVKLRTRPIFELNINEGIYLHTGEFCIDESYDKDKIEIRIYEGDIFTQKIKIEPLQDLVFNKEITMKGYIIKRKKILLNCSPLNKLSYKIFCDQTELFSSKNRLFRMNLFFDSYGKEIKPGTNCHDDDCFVLTSQKACNIEEDSPHTVIIRKTDYNICKCTLNSKDIFRFDGNPYVFYKVNNCKFIGYSVPWTSFLDMNNKTRKVHKEAIIIFETTYVKEELFIRVNNQFYTNSSTSNIKYKIYLLSTEYTGTYVYLLKIYGLSAGFYSVSIYSNITNSILNDCNFEFIYDEKINRNFITYDESSTVYDLDTSFVRECVRFSYPFGETNLFIDGFVGGLGHGKLIIYPSVFCYSLDNKKWQIIDNDFNYYENKKQFIYICGPNNSQPYLTSKDIDNCQPKYLTIKNECEDPFKFKVFLNILNVYKNIRNARINFFIGNKIRYLNIKFTPKIQFNRNLQYYEELDKIICDISYEGALKPWLILKNKLTEEILYASEVENNNPLCINKDDFSNKMVNMNDVIASLHLPSNSFFNKYESNAFINIGNIIINYRKFVDFINIESVDAKYLIIDYKFKHIDKFVLRVCPSGFNTIIYSKDITCNSGRIQLEIENQIYNSYNVLLYKMNGNGKLTHFYTSKCKKVSSKFIYKTFSINQFNLEDGSSLNLLNYSLKFKKIITIDEIDFLLASMTVGTKEIDNILIKIFDRDKKSYSCHFHRLYNGKIIDMRLKEGKKIESIVIQSKEVMYGS